MIPYVKHQVTQEDIDAVTECLRSDFLAGNGNVVRAFEKAIAEYTGYRFAIAVNSATSGLMVAYAISLSETLSATIPALTFVATHNMLNRSIPYRIKDVQNTLTLDRSDVGVSFAGYPVYHCLVADDAHYLYPDQVNNFNKISVISTHPAKHITTGEGGVILTNDPVYYDEMSRLVDQGRGVNRVGFGFGYNFRMPSINAALGLSQLSRARANLAVRKRIAMFYMERLGGYDKIELPPWHPDHAWHLFVIRLRGIDRDWFREELKKEGIGTQVHYPPLYHYPHIRKTEDCPVAEDAYANGLSIPLFSSMTTQETWDVVNAIEKVYGRSICNSSAG